MIGDYKCILIDPDLVIHFSMVTTILLLLYAFSVLNYTNSALMLWLYFFKKQLHQNKPVPGRVFY